MTQHNSPDSPVRAATFPDGPDFLLLNPDVSERQWRGERLRAGLRPQIILTGLAGSVLVVLAVSSGFGFAAVFALVAGVLTVGASALAGWHAATRVLTDHRHGPENPCRLDYVRREFFLRSRAFTSLGTAGAAARTLIAGVDELHRTPARAWIDPALCGEVHRVVWQALCCLDRTRAARTLATELAADSDTEVGELAAAARQAVTAIDEGLDEVARHVHGCLVLTREWERKLRHTHLAARTENTLADLPGPAQVQRLSEAAEALEQNVFAYVTAARDIVRAGTFPWERPPSSWARPRSIQPSPGTTPRRAPSKRVRSDGEPS